MNGQLPNVLHFHCGACEAELTVPVDLAGVTGPCPSCYQLIQAPYPQQWLPPQPAQPPSYNPTTELAALPLMRSTPVGSPPAYATYPPLASHHSIWDQPPLAHEAPVPLGFSPDLITGAIPTAEPPPAAVPPPWADMNPALYTMPLPAAAAPVDAAPQLPRLTRPALPPMEPLPSEAPAHLLSGEHFPQLAEMPLPRHLPTVPGPLETSARMDSFRARYLIPSIPEDQLENTWMTRERESAKARSRRDKLEAKADRAFQRKGVSFARGTLIVLTGSLLFWTVTHMKDNDWTIAFLKPSPSSPQQKAAPAALPRGEIVEDYIAGADTLPAPANRKPVSTPSRNATGALAQPPAR